VSAAAHPVFANAPLGSGIALSTGPTPIPYYVYDGNGVIVVGPCAASAIVTDFHPAQDSFEVGGVLGQYGIVPKIVQHIWPFRFVYRHPDDF
jgi:hypothetical protein